MSLILDNVITEISELQYEIMLLKEENKAKDDEIRSVWYEAQEQTDSEKSLVIF